MCCSSLNNTRDQNHKLNRSITIHCTCSRSGLSCPICCKSCGKVWGFCWTSRLSSRNWGWLRKNSMPLSPWRKKERNVIGMHWKCSILFISGNCDDLQLATAQLSLQANNKQIAPSALFKVAFGSCLSLLRCTPPALNSCQSPWRWKHSVIHQRLTPRNQALRIESRSTLNGAARPSFKMAGKGRACWRDYFKLNLNFQPSSLEKVYTNWLTYLSGLSTAACRSGTCWYYFSNANNILIKSRMLLFAVNFNFFMVNEHSK